MVTLLVSGAVVGASVVAASVVVAARAEVVVEGAGLEAGARGA